MLPPPIAPPPNIGGFGASAALIFPPFAPEGFFGGIIGFIGIISISLGMVIYRSSSAAARSSRNDAPPDSFHSSSAMGSSGGRLGASLPAPACGLPRRTVSTSHRSCADSIQQVLEQGPETVARRRRSPNRPWSIG